MNGHFPSLLFDEPTKAPVAAEQRQDHSFARDLNLDQVVAAIARDREEADLITDTLFSNLRIPGTVRYRQEVFRDLDNPALLSEFQRFADRMAQVRAHLRQLTEMRYAYQREGWLLDAAAIYCDAVQSLTAYLGTAQVTSRALLAFREYLASYVASAGSESVKRSGTSGCLRSL